MKYRLKTILKESSPILLITAAISIIAGFVLNGNEHILQALPGILLIIPAFLNMGGNMIGVLSSRLSSGLHLGYISPHLRKTKFLERNILASYMVGIVSFLALGIIAGSLNTLFGQGLFSLLIFPVVILLAGMLTIVVLSVLSVLFTYLSSGRGIDPDNIVIPLLTSLGDFIGLLLLFYILSVVV